MKERRPTRLREYDYGAAGYYFVTICIKDRQMLLSSVGAGHPAGPCLRLTHYGEIVDQHISSISKFYPAVQVDKYVIMPNHVYLILCLKSKAGPAGCPAPTAVSVPKIVGVLKSLTTRAAGLPLWQRSYYDHVIRDEADHLRIWEYIDSNPARWAEDEYWAAPEKKEEPQ